MTYSQFLQFIGNAFNLFKDTFLSVADMLIKNYFFITILGIPIFISLIWLVYNLIHDILTSKIDMYEEYSDKMKNYELNQEVKYDYLKKHRLDVYDYVYDMSILRQQVLNGIYRNHKDLILDNKIENFKLNAEALKKMKKEQLLDDNDSNDNDADMFSNIPVPPMKLANKQELKTSWLKEFGEDMKKENKNEIENIMYENKDLLNKIGVYYDYNSNNFYDSKTGELVDITSRGYNSKTGEIIKNIYSLDSDNLRHINGKTININTGEIISNEIAPIPVGDIELSKMTPEQLDKIKKFNDEHFIFPSSNNNHKYGNFDENLDAQLFN